MFCMKCGTSLAEQSPTPDVVHTNRFQSGKTSPGPPELAISQEAKTLVGRDLEVAWLVERWNRAKEAEGQVVLLNGEAGIGKSRLVQAVKALVAEDEPTWLAECRCSPDYQNSALHPFIDLLEGEMLSFESQDSPQEKLSKLKAFLVKGSAAAEQMLPLFATLLSLPTDESYVPIDLTPEQQKRDTLQALLSVLLAQAKHRPMLLIVEDLHWVDPSTQELLHLIIDQVPTAPILAIFTFRPTFQPPWPARSHLTSLTLTRLSRQQVTQIIERVTGGVSLPDDVVEQIVTRTDGVPLFVEELTRTVLESGLLEQQEERYVLKGELPQLAIPATLRDSLMARLSRLAPMTHEVVQLSATIGREFSYELLAGVSPLEEEVLQQALSQLVDAELLYQRGISPHATYLFKHALIRDAAYESTLRTRQQQYHQQVAAVLSERFPQIVEGEPELLAHHYTAAGIPDKAIRYWRRAAARAVEQSAHLEATYHLAKGISLLNTLPPDENRTALQIELLLRQERLYQTLGAREQQQATINGLFKCIPSEDFANLAETYVRQGDFYTELDRFDDAERVLNEALAIRRELSDATGESYVLRSLGYLRWHQGDYQEARAYNEAALEIDQARGDALAVATDLTNLSDVLRNIGDGERALSCLEEALEIYQTAQNPSREGFTLYQMANVYRQDGANEQAMTYYRRAYDILIRCRDLVMAERAQAGMANLYWEQGQTDESLRLYKEVTDITRDIKHGQTLAHTLHTLGELLLTVNQPEAALSYLIESTDVFAELADAKGEAAVWENMAEIYAQVLKDDQKAFAAWERVRELRKQTSDYRGELEALQQMGQLARRRGDAPAQVLWYLHEAKMLAVEIDDRAKQGELLNTMGIVEWHQKAYANALAHYEEALEIYREHRDMARAGLMLNSIGVTMRCLGRYDDALSRLREAVATNRQAGQRQFEGHSLTVIADICRDQGKHEQALHYYRASLDIRREIHDRSGEGWMLRALGRGYAKLNSFSQAHECLEQALAIAEECADEELRQECLRIQDEISTQ